MTISYNWLHEYLPQQLDPLQLSEILTSVGLEVESMEAFDSVRGGLHGLVVGKVIHCEPHPNADKLRLTKVDIGGAAPLQIVCGAPNVATGQTVVVAPVGTTIYPLKGEPFEIKKAKIRGEESQGMICAEDEISLGESHDGIIVLPDSVAAGTSVREHYGLGPSDTVYEIGLTPNRMDAMSHLGVARDVCAYLSHASGSILKPLIPEAALPVAENSNNTPVEIHLEDTARCGRYAGICLANLTVADSPEWLQQRLRALGLRPINNVVDITNFVMHECGQPLHAFDLTEVKGHRIVVKTLQEKTPFLALDGKEIALSHEDLMICDTEGPLCMAGVYGGLTSGVKAGTQSIFLESAWFLPDSIRRSSMRHGLRTDAAIRFEKGADISMVPYALARAVQLMKEICGATVLSSMQDVYPVPHEQKLVSVTFDRIRSLAGKSYSNAQIRQILVNLGFSVLTEDEQQMQLAVPFSKPDISMPADLVEEVMRIDGLDNIPFTGKIAFSLQQQSGYTADYTQHVATQLVAKGFFELFTNSITNATYYPGNAHLVTMINSLSAHLDTMRPSMLETGLEAIAYNLNRKKHQLKFFEFGKVYARSEGHFIEVQQLALYISGNYRPPYYTEKAMPADLYFLRGIVEGIVPNLKLVFAATEKGLNILYRNQVIGQLEAIDAATLKRFDIRQAVWFAVLNWDVIRQALESFKQTFTEIPKFPVVQRDLAMVVDRAVTYDALDAAVKQAKSKLLQRMNLFDVFESEKLGEGKKSVALNFSFYDAQKTLTDSEVESEMKLIAASLEKKVGAVIRGN